MKAVLLGGQIVTYLGLGYLSWRAGSYKMAAAEVLLAAVQGLIFS